MTRRFLRFTLIGGLGFLVDVSVLYGVLWIGAGLYGGRALSFLTAVTFTWWFNRQFTFGVSHASSYLREWARFASVNMVGGAANYAVYAVLVTFVQVFAEHPFLAVMAGSAAGLGLNFSGTSLLVFRTEQVPGSAAVLGPTSSSDRKGS